MATTPLADFLAAQGLTQKAMPPDFQAAPGDPVYVKVASTPAEAGVDDQVSVLVFSDGTAAPAEDSPYQPTNDGDPGSPQQVSQSTGAAPYAPGILHEYPDDMSIVPGGGIYPPPPPPVTVWTASVMTAANPSVATVAVTTDLEVGTLVSLSGDPLVDGQDAEVLAISGTDVTLDIDLSGGAPAGPVTLTKV